MAKETINFDDFTKLDIRIGTITEVEKVENAYKLLKFMVDVGLKPSALGADGSPDSAKRDLGEDRDIRQILSGIAEHFTEPEILVGRQVPVLVNLESRNIRGHESQGMILYVVEDDLVVTLEPSEKNIAPGTSVR